MVHSASMSPASPGTWSKLKLLLTGDSARRSQQTLTTRLGLPGTNNSQDPSPHPKAKGGYPLIHRGKLQYTGTELGSNQNCHPCSLPLTIGNSRVVESPTPLPEPLLCVEVRPTISSRNFSTSRTNSGSFPTREVTFHVPRASLCSRGSDRQGDEPTGRGSHVASSGFAQPDSMGRGPATRRSPTCPTPRPGSRRGPR
ncbi:hypothetical protein D4764_01G0016410 [Takifugu flavidus]|uniref:Uncharacterized protein n=1 Tax=Takifugu flavidus TaxID=433684 RepID=A0A5C6PSB0_9TELE|nr:hypothetical protein D4764_01G0016410 [Takifugu flavidus]